MQQDIFKPFTPMFNSLLSINAYHVIVASLELLFAL